MGRCENSRSKQKKEQRYKSMIKIKEVIHHDNSVALFKDLEANYLVVSNGIDLQFRSYEAANQAFEDELRKLSILH